MSKYQALLQEWQTFTPPPKIGTWPILIYGAGDAGRKVAGMLAARGCRIAGFLDVHAKPDTLLADKPVTTLEDWLTQNDPIGHEVVVAISNQIYLRQLPLLITKINGYGFRQCSYDPYLIEEAISPQNVDLFSFAQRKELYSKSYAELDRLDALLADETSRIALADAVRAWSTLTTMCHIEPDEYHPGTLPAWPQPLRFIDCGAFDGDTLADFRQAGYTLEAVAAFEPDPSNFKNLAHNTAHEKNIVRFPCAVGSKTEILFFSATSDAGSHIAIADEGKIFVQCVALDDVLPTFVPNLIKMDIEGAEPNALLGAQCMITQHHPALAICLYHRPDHLWRIPFLIDSWALNYRFYIRQHHPFCGLVLYALPTDSFK
jgi:FkbM family methyltransferase